KPPRLDSAGTSAVSPPAANAVVGDAVSGDSVGVVPGVSLMGWAGAGAARTSASANAPLVRSSMIGNAEPSMARLAGRGAGGRGGVGRGRSGEELANPAGISMVPPVVVSVAVPSVTMIQVVDEDGS